MSWKTCRNLANVGKRLNVQFGLHAGRYMSMMPRYTQIHTHTHTFTHTYVCTCTHAHTNTYTCRDEL